MPASVNTNVRNVWDAVIPFVFEHCVTALDLTQVTLVCFRFLYKTDGGSNGPILAPISRQHYDRCFRFLYGDFAQVLFWC